jgi:hypothetical protein
MEWEWDEDKNAENVRKHEVTFEEALQVFIDPDGIEKEDLAHSSPSERRRWRTGRLHSGRIVTVVYTLRRDKIRLISAQERRRERGEYEKANKQNNG